jgi:hypothetical protein
MKEPIFACLIIPFVLKLKAVTPLFVIPALDPADSGGNP